MSHTDSGSFMLTGPHQILSVEVSSSTILLSFGERPVFFPDEVAIAPADVIAEPDSLSVLTMIALPRQKSEHTIRGHLHTVLGLRDCR